ncbi:MAG: thioredoxin family protein [Micavibrio sp.]|nr:thioredoxin family protein [Micavibrio sp.]
MFRMMLAVLLLAATPGMAFADSREAARNAAAQAAAATAIEIGKPAPNFEATDSTGKTHKLSDLRGRIVVLEWTNDQCPYVRKFYDAGAMQKMQQDATGKGIVWLSVVSSAKGKEGYTEADAANRDIAQFKSRETGRLLDPTGALGHMYGATSTPHMFVIDKAGVLAYSGAMDDQPSVSPSTLRDAKNYVLAAIDELSANRPVAIATSKPYGCAVKY